VADQGSNKKVANNLVVLSSAAIVAVYSAGFARTREAASRFTQQDAERRAHAPIAHEGRAPRPESAAAAPIAVDQQASHADRALAERAASPQIADVATPARASEAREPNPKGSPHAAHAAATPHAAAPVTTVHVADRATNVDVIDDRQANADASPHVAKTAATAVGTPSAPAAPATPAAPSTPAPSPNVAPASAVAGATPKFRDGTYLGWGTSRHGDIQAVVVVESGRITTTRVAQCLTRYSCAWVDPIPPVILKAQAPTYDYVSGATESSDAFQTAVADALSHALFTAQ
jgi:uncharacterized protein with FMN-binding domain